GGGEPACRRDERARGRGATRELRLQALRFHDRRAAERDPGASRRPRHLHGPGHRAEPGSHRSCHRRRASRPGWRPGEPVSERSPRAAAAAQGATAAARDRPGGRPAELRRIDSMLLALVTAILTATSTTGRTDTTFEARPGT